MDIMFLSFALILIIADLNIKGAAAGSISSLTNEVGKLLGGVIFGVLADKYGTNQNFYLYDFNLRWQQERCISQAIFTWFTSSVF